MRGYVALAVIWLCLGWEHSVLAEPDAGGPVLPRVTAAEAGYSVTHWTVEDGLPQSTITSLAQTPDGYLWCGTTAGLLRFDGTRFRLFSRREIPELKDVEVLELLCDSAGRLWIGGTDGQIVVFEQGRFRTEFLRSGNRSLGRIQKVISGSMADPRESSTAFGMSASRP